MDHAARGGLSQEFNPYEAPGEGRLPSGTALAGDPTTVRYLLTEEDVAGLARYLIRHRRQLLLRMLLLPALMGVGVATGLALPRNHPGASTWILPAAVGMVVFLFLAVLTYRGWIRRVVAESRSNRILGDHSAAITPRGLAAWTYGRGEALYYWEGLEEVAATDRHLFLFVTGVQAVVVPRRDFPTPEAAEEFLRIARERHAAARGAQASPA